MFTASDLDNFGKTVSENFITKNIPLTEGVTKVAEAQGLTSYQIDRIVESANIETHLTLMKTASDKYVEFDVANAKEAKSSLKSIKMAVDLSDYNDAPSIFTFNKTASVVEDREQTETELRKEAQLQADRLEFLNMNVLDESATLGAYSDQLKTMVKQAVLGNYTFNDVAEIIKVATPTCSEYLVTSIKEELKPNMPFINLDTDPTPDLRPNPESDIFKTAEKLEEIAIKISKLGEALNHFQEAYDVFVKEASLPKVVGHTARAAGEVLKSVGGIIKKNPKTTAALVAGAVVYGAGKNRGVAEQGTILQKKLIQHRMGRRYA